MEDSIKKVVIEECCDLISTFKESVTAGQSFTAKELATFNAEGGFSYQGISVGLIQDLNLLVQEGLLTETEGVYTTTYKFTEEMEKFPLPDGVVPREVTSVAPKEPELALA